MTATDISPGALDLARANGAGLGLEVEWLESDLLAAVAGRQFDLIVSNPPYIPAAELETLEPEVRLWEPRVATTPGQGGLEVLLVLVRSARAALTPGGLLAVECGAGQSGAAGRRAGRRGVHRHRRARGLRRDRAVRHRAAAVSHAEQGALLLAGELAILPTDTVYGIACAAASPAAVERLYALKPRPSTQPTAILLGSVESLLSDALPEAHGRVGVLLPTRAARPDDAGRSQSRTAVCPCVRRRRTPASACACPC